MASFLDPNESRAAAFVHAFQPLGPEIAQRVMLATWRQLPVQDRAAISADWSFWAREKQRPPAGNWTTWGFLTARGVGKTLTLASYIVEEIREGRAPLTCALAQDEQHAIDLQILGPSGLMETAPPWFKPEWHRSDLQLVWPNGAQTFVRTPEVPGKIRGLEYYLSWMSELQSWPKSTMREAFDNVLLSTRLGYNRVVWDSTPKRRHPILKELLTEGERDPSRHVIVRGTTYENALNLGEGYVEKLERKFGGTARGKEELEGLMLEETELSTVKQTWIDDHRRNLPTSLARRVLSIDPAVTVRKGSDTTGLVECALGTDGQGYVLQDKSGKPDADAWGTWLLDTYLKNQCDLILAETNKGGSLVIQNLKVLARERGLEVIVVGKKERPSRVAGKIFVKEVYARGAKDERAEPVGTAYQRGRISHVIGADLGGLEDTLTTWEAGPNADSPGDLDALVQAMVELLDLNNDEPPPKAAFVGIETAQKALAKPTTQTVGTFTNYFPPERRGL